jgi:hypothetical protein
MLNLDEWLVRVGLEKGNPFARKQADEEGPLLQEYFVEHPAYNAMLDSDQPRSSILHAPRGAGKSSTRRMFETFCAEQAMHLRPLIVPLMDWLPIMEPIAAAPAGDISPHYHLEELLRQVVLMLAHDERPPQATPPDDADMAGYLSWMCHTYGTYLPPTRRDVLHKRGWLHHQPDTAAYDIQAWSVPRSLTLLVRVLHALGYRTCYVLVDRIDELQATVGSWATAARLLAPLVSNLAITEVPGLAFKYFVPSEVIAILRSEGTLREDRIGCFELTWQHTQLGEMLRSRLRVFSDGRIESLASLAVPDIRDIDDRLSAAAAGSPRRLLNLGERVLHLCAQTANDENLLIRAEHLDAALGQTADRPDSISLPAQGMPVQARLTATPQPSSGSHPEASPVPPLRMPDDGSIRRGDTPIDGWWNLPLLQRRFLDYLYQNRGKLCRRNEIMNYIWANGHTPTDEGALRKLGERLIHFVEPDPDAPVYIKKVRGGHYRLDNADD